MCIARPEYLPFLWLLFPAVMFAFYGARRKLRIRQRLAGGSADPAIVPEFRFSRLLARRLLTCAAIGLFFFAAAGPELCSGQKSVRRKGADVVFMLDVSTSMFARDVAPDRLRRAKAEILEISRRFGEGRRALLLFAAIPVVQCPLTTDQELFETLLDMATPEQVEAQGTVYRRAFDAAMRLVEGARRERAGQAVLVLAGDGEDHGRELGAAVAAMKSKGVRMYAVGIGSGTPVPIPLPATASRPASWKRDADGQVVMTRFRPEFFTAVSSESGARFYHSRPEAPVGPAVAAAIAGEAAAARWVMAPANRQPLHQPVVAVAVLLLFAGIVSGDLPRQRRS
jgi:Ca-activated chloride channel family protein